MITPYKDTAKSNTYESIRPMAMVMATAKTARHSTRRDAMHISSVTMVTSTKSTAHAGGKIVFHGNEMFGRQENKMKEQHKFQAYLL